MPPKVYIINKSFHDFSCAERYGEIVYLSKGTINKYATNRIARQFSEALRGASENDYLLLTSLTVMNCIACVIFALRFKKLNLLLLKDNDYVCHRLDFSDIK